MSKHYSTDDIYLASTLLALGYILIELDRSKPRVRFLFHSEEGIEQTVAGYWSNSVCPPAQQLLTAHKNLKARLYSGA